jgi:hypothetical protein
MDFQRKPALVKQILKRWRLLLGCNGHVESPTSHWKQHQAIDDLAWTKLRNIEAPESMASTTTSRTPQKWIGDWSWGLQRVIVWRHHTYWWILCRGERPSIGQYEMFVMSQYGAMLIRTIGKNTVFFLICFYERWFQDRGKYTLFIYLVFYIVYPCD